MGILHRANDARRDRQCARMNVHQLLHVTLQLSITGGLSIESMSLRAVYGNGATLYRCEHVTHAAILQNTMHSQKYRL